MKRFIFAVIPNTIQELWFAGNYDNSKQLNVRLYAKELAQVCGRTMKYIDFNNCSFSDTDLSLIVKSTAHAIQLVFWSCKFSFTSELVFDGPSFKLSLLSFQFSGKFTILLLAIFVIIKKKHNIVSLILCSVYY